MDIKLQRHARINMILALSVYSLFSLTLVLLLISGVASTANFDLKIFGATPVALSLVSGSLATLASILGYFHAAKAEKNGYDLSAA